MPHLHTCKCLDTYGLALAPFGCQFCSLGARLCGCWLPTVLGGQAQVHMPSVCNRNAVRTCQCNCRAVCSPTCILPGDIVGRETGGICGPGGGADDGPTLAEVPRAATRHSIHCCCSGVSRGGCSSAGVGCSVDLFSDGNRYTGGERLDDGCRLSR